MHTEEHTIPLPSEGGELSATMFIDGKNNDDENTVIAGGTGNIKEMLNGIAGYLADNGKNTTIFDYRGFGKSSPLNEENEINWREQRKDLLGVFDYLKELKISTRNGVGHSYGATNMTFASLQEDLNKIVLACPFTVKSFLMSKMSTAIKLSPLGMNDLIRQALGKQAKTFELNSMFEECDAFEELAKKENVEFKNNIPSRELIRCLFNTPALFKKKKLQQKDIMMVSFPNDDVVHQKTIKKFAKDINAKEVSDMDSSHFDFYKNEKLWKIILGFLNQKS